jgi:L-fuconolactonase
MVTEARWHDWKPEHFRPYLDVVMNAFSPARLMIGSDWPVCTVSANYGRTLGLVRDYISQLTSSEQESILGRNCSHLYAVT